MEFVPTETLMYLASCLMPSLTRGHSRARRNRRFRSFFGTSVETCADLGENFDFEVVLVLALTRVLVYVFCVTAFFIQLLCLLMCFVI